MNDLIRHGREYEVRFYESDGRGRLLAVHLLGLIEETAASHCAAAGLDIHKLRDRGFGWVLLRGSLDMQRYPRYRERFRVETWVSWARRMFATREYRIVSERGEVLGSARSLWLFYDLGSAKPAAIMPLYLDAWQPQLGGPSPFPDDDQDRPQLSQPGPGAFNFTVRPSEIDTNCHVNNVAYIAWVFDVLPFDMNGELVLRRLYGRFVREVLPGETVTASATVYQESSEGTRVGLGVFAREVRVEGQRLVLSATADSLWAPESS